MKNKFYLKKSGIILFIILLIGLPDMTAFAQTPNIKLTLASVTKDDTIAPANSKSLIKVLDDLETRYQVNFNYNTDKLEGKFVKNNLLGKRINLEQTLKSVLTPLGLKFEKLQNRYYLIYSGKSSNRLLPI